MSPRPALAPLAALALAALAPAAHAEELPHYKPDQLALYSDVALLATEVTATELRVERVLAGKWQGKQIRVPQLAAFRKQPGPRGGGERPVQITPKCVVFLKVRGGQGGVVANGVFRVAAGGGVLGYRQDHNPGGYELQADPFYPSLPALLNAVAAAEAKVPRKKEALMRELATEPRYDLLAGGLHELLRITRPGDAEVLQFVTRGLERGGEHAQLYRQFLQNLHVPEAYPLLKEHFERTGDASVLYSIGYQGTPAACDFLADLARREGKAERRWIALDALSRLYGVVEQAGDTRARIKVREAIITLYDAVPFLANYVAGHPRILGAITHPEAITRLEQILARVRGDGTNREYEVELVLRECRRKLARQLLGR
jgi:hypothetical protein